MYVKKHISFPGLWSYSWAIPAKAIINAMLQGRARETPFLVIHTG